MEYKGEIFEPGKLYKFKDYGSFDWVVGELVAIDPDGRFRCKHGQVSEPFDVICEIDREHVGTIVQKPIELIDGRCYAFYYNGQHQK